MIENLALYKFVEIEDPEATRDWLLAGAEQDELLGTVLVAPEGINCMLAGTPEAAQRFETYLRSDSRFEDIWIKRSESDEVTFKHLKGKIKPEIVTMRVDGVDARATGKHVTPEDFRDWLRGGEDMVVIDTRNSFEFHMGTFEGSVNPETTAFKEFPQYVLDRKDELADKRVVMFCTGGIRCEKATSWMKTLGLDNVYQLEGGILNYFETIPDAEKDWKGELFVFDERVGIDTKLNATDATLCPECGVPRSSQAGVLCDHA